MVVHGAQARLRGPGGVITDWAVPEGAGQALAVGNMEHGHLHRGLHPRRGYRTELCCTGLCGSIVGYKGPRVLCCE